MNSRMFRVVCLAAWAALVLGAGSAAQARVVVKMATLAPEGSVWDKVIREMGADWQEGTGGEVSLRVYPGGVAGDEPDLVRKMRIGQMHAAALSTQGLGVIDPGFEIFQIPMFYRNYEELFHVLEVLRPDLEKRLEERGFILLNWGNGGWIHFFSKKPIRSVDDLKEQKIFSWAGNDGMIQLWRKNGFQPVALSATDILTGLQTGMIEALPTTPLAALSLQWFRQTPYMQNLGLAPLVGATVLSKQVWDKMSPEVQKEVRRVAMESEERFYRDIPEQDAKAIEQMKQRGLEVVDVDKSQSDEWQAAAEKFANILRGQMEATELLDKARQARDNFRAKQAASASTASEAQGR